MTWGTRTRRRSELPATWPRIRAQVLARDRWACQVPDLVTGRPCHAKASEVDHVGDRHDHRLENLRAACQDCHRKRTAAQGVQAKGYGPTRKRPPEPHPGERP